MALPQLADVRGSDIAQRLDLGGERLEAALTDDRNALILAGPGAGKTYLLVAHAAHLAETYEGRVVVLTYTRNAARELEQRIAGLVAPFAARRVVACTLHAYARDLLTVHGHRIGLGHPQEILDRRDVDVLARKAANEIGATAPPRFASTLERLLRRRTLRTEDRQDSTLFGRVLNLMRIEGKLTWESCIDLAIELLDTSQEVASSVRYHDRFLLLDEAQDCDPAQLAFLDRLLGRDGTSHLFVAMDPDQNLYAFRDADPDFVLGWAMGHSPVEFELTENYRCQPRIAAVARYVLDYPAIRKSSDGGTARFFHGRSRQGEARFVAEKVARRISDGTAPEKIAVLARRNDLLEEVRTCLVDSGIAVRKSGKNGLSRQELAVLWILEFLYEWEEGKQPGPRTAMILRRLFKMPEEEIKRREAEAFQNQGTHPGEALADPRWLELRSLREGRIHPSVLVLRTAEIFQWDLGDDEILRTLAAQTRTLSQLLRQARNGALPETPSGQGVLVSSFHASKGLEFDIVFVMACEDGVIPDYRAKTEDSLREERRALYVAMTRAGDELVVTCSGRGKNRPKPSRFLPPSESTFWS